MIKIITTALILTFSLSVYAGSSCKTDWQGNYVCDYDDGYQTKTKKDWQGYDVTTDNKGNTEKCKTDWQGNYVCD